MSLVKKLNKRIKTTKDNQIPSEVSDEYITYNNASQENIDEEAFNLEDEEALEEALEDVDNEDDIVTLDEFGQSVNSGSNKSRNKKNEGKSRSKDNSKGNVKKSDSRKMKKSNAKHKASIFEHITNSTIDVITKGELDYQTEDFQLTQSKILGLYGAKRVLTIVEYPTLVEEGFLHEIRRQIEREFDVKIISKFDGTGKRFSFGESKEGKMIGKKENTFHNRLDRVTGDLERISFQIQNGKATERGNIAGLKKQQSRLSRKVESYEHIDNMQREGYSMLLGFQFLEVIGEDIRVVDEAYERLVEIMQRDGFIVTDNRDLKNYLNNFGLAKNPMNNKKAMFADMVIPPDVKSSEVAFTSGILRTPNGFIYAGHEITSWYPVHISFNEDAGAANLLVLASTGSGKTVSVKSMVTDALIHPLYRALIHDAKGGEWFPSVEDIKGATLIDVSNNFVNTLKIPNHKLLGLNEPKDAYTLAVNITTAILTTLASDNHEEWISSICGDMVVRTLVNAGVDAELPMTYILSDDIKFRDAIWKTIEDMTDSESTKTRHGLENFYKVRRALEQYFHAKGAKSYYFTNEINIEDILNSKIIVADYAEMTSTNRITQTATERSAKQLQVDFLSSIYTIYNKHHGYFTIEADEEVASRISNKFLAANLNRRLSGERSMNKINILITAAIGGLLVGESDDGAMRTSSLADADIAAIRESITMLMIGKVKRSVAESAIRVFSLEANRTEILHVARNIGEYKKTFYLSQIQNGDIEATVRFEIPQDLLDSKVYASRKEVSNDVNTLYQKIGEAESEEIDDWSDLDKIEQIDIEVLPENQFLKDWD